MMGVAADVPVGPGTIAEPLVAPVDVGGVDGVVAVTVPKRLANIDTLVDALVGDFLAECRVARPGGRALRFGSAGHLRRTCPDRRVSRSLQVGWIPTMVATT
jgi:hypothetical protein